MIRIAAVVATIATLVLGCTSVPAEPTVGATAGVSTPAASPPASTGVQTPGESTGPIGSSALCGLTNTAELGSTFGGTWTLGDVTSDSCTWGSDQFAGLTIRFESGNDFTAANMVLSNAQQTTVAGKPAVVGEFMGPLLYVQIGPNQQFVVQGVLMGTDDTTRQGIIGLAAAMIGRM